jgi:hypothetical protein
VSLSRQATEIAASARTDARIKDEERQRQHRETLIDFLWGVFPNVDHDDIHLGDHLVLKRFRVESRTPIIAELRGYRATVDDVELLVGSYWGSGPGGRWTPLLPCTVCGELTANIHSSGSPGHGKGFSPEYTLQMLGADLNHQAICANCRARDYDARCPRCHKPYFTEEA